MRIVKRILAGFLAVSVLFSSNMICFTAIAEGTNDTNITMPDSNVTEGDFELTIDIPEQWSNDIKKWTITTDDADLFYKISDDIIDEKEWGSYTDDDIKKWNDGEDFDEGEGYIKFWAVKEVNGEAIPSVKKNLLLVRLFLINMIKLFQIHLKLKKLKWEKKQTNLYLRIKNR